MTQSNIPVHHQINACIRKESLWKFLSMMLTRASTVCIFVDINWRWCEALYFYVSISVCLSFKLLRFYNINWLPVYLITGAWIKLSCILYLVSYCHLVVSMVLSYIGNGFHRVGLYYSPRFARGCKADPRGVKDRPWKHFSLSKKQLPRWNPFPM